MICVLACIQLVYFYRQFIKSHLVFYLKIQPSQSDHAVFIVKWKIGHIRFAWNADQSSRCYKQISVWWNNCQNIWNTIDMDTIDNVSSIWFTWSSPLIPTIFISRIVHKYVCWDFERALVLETENRWNLFLPGFHMLSELTIIEVIFP